MYIHQEYCIHFFKIILYVPGDDHRIYWFTTCLECHSISDSYIGKLKKRTNIHVFDLRECMVDLLAKKERNSFSPKSRFTTFFLSQMTHEHFFRTIFDGRKKSSYKP